MKSRELRSELRARLGRGATLAVPGVHDALSARQAERAGMGAVHAGSYSIASSMALPDVGLVTMTELCQRVREMADAVAVPVIADAENGFVAASGIARVVRAYEQAGASAIHIEDHVSGKHTAERRQVAPFEEAVGKIRAALEAREDPALLIIARTDVAWATGSVADSLARMQAFAAAGADAVMPTGLSLEALRAIRHAIPAPVVIVNAGGHTLAEEQAAGADLVIYHSLCIEAAAQGVEEALRAFARTSRVASARAATMPPEAMMRLIGYPEHAALADPVVPVASSRADAVS